MIVIVVNMTIIIMFTKWGLYVYEECSFHCHLSEIRSNWYFSPFKPVRTGFSLSSCGSRLKGFMSSLHFHLVFMLKRAHPAVSQLSIICMPAAHFRFSSVTNFPEVANVVSHIDIWGSGY